MEQNGGFFRVRITVDITQALCRGRVITLENGLRWFSNMNVCPIYVIGAGFWIMSIKIVNSRSKAKVLFKKISNSMGRVYELLHSSPSIIQ